MSIFGTYNSFHFDGGNAGPTAGPTGPTGPEGLMNFLLRINQNIGSNHPLYRSTFVSDVENTQVVPTSYIDVASQLPNWMSSRNETNPAAMLISVLQVYYNWLYSANGSQYILDDRFQFINDSRLSPDETIRHLLGNFVPGVDSLASVTLDDDNEDPFLVSNQAIKNFVSGIQDTFYKQKGTPTSIAYFFNTLLSASSTQIETTEPASYSVSITHPRALSEQDYTDYYMEHVHPVGTDVFISQQSGLEDTGIAFLRGGESGGFSGDIPQFTAWEELVYGDGAYDGTGTGEEISILGNYFPYTLGDTSAIAVSAGCSGSTAHGGISGGATGNTANMLTFTFPDWSTAYGISGSSFGLINIYEFAHLSAASGNTSPNDGIVGNYSCPAGGYS